MWNRIQTLCRIGRVRLVLLATVVALTADRSVAAGRQEIVIVVPFAGADRETRIWAEQEEGIDFRRQPDLAARCTAAFAAVELADHLQKTLADTTIAFAPARPKDKTFIELAIAGRSTRNDAFQLRPEGGGVVIEGRGRTGLLYGAYELLRMQGWRWYAPGENGAVVPPKRDVLALPRTARSYAPAMTRGRGFFMSPVSAESTDLCLWMARNRLNLIGYRPNTGPLAAKLGMTFNVGGHIFEAILAPDRVMSSGKTLWEEHPQWYGLPASGRRKKSSALATQFCVSQPELLDFLGRELLKKVIGPWRQADLVEVWGFDTWGSTCTCPECRALGNSTDQMLHFLSAMRRCLNRATADGRLDHPLTLSGCAYEGTSTMGGPDKPFPADLIAAHDVIVFYPINRCYAHGLYDNTCTDTRRYRADLKSWLARTPNMDVFFGEYYNVSKYEDLPLLFTATMRGDIPGHHAAGCRGLTYMHLPLVNWSVRTLTQNLYAQLAWDPGTDVDKFLAEYFNLWYGPFADRIRTVYDHAESAWRDVSQWRNWDKTSVLSRLLRWQGGKPAQTMAVPAHLGDASQAAESGRQAVAKLDAATEILASLRRRAEYRPPYELRIGEDCRALRYGRDTIQLMSLLVEYHEALRLDQAEQNGALWRRIEHVSATMEGYWVPISYAGKGHAGLESHDALTRTQLRSLVSRCRDYRIKNHLPMDP